MNNYSITALNGGSLRSFLPVATLMDDVTGSGNIGTIVSTWADGFSTPTTVAGEPPCLAMIPLPNGKIVLVPCGMANFQILDPATGNITQGAPHGLGNNAFGTAVLLPNGLILCVPYSAPNFGLYDPVRNIFTIGQAHGIANGGAPIFAGAVLDCFDIVRLVPGLSTTLDSYDYTQSTPYTVGPSVPGAVGTPSAFSGGALMPNGDVYMVPGVNPVAYLFKKASQTVVASAQSVGTASIYAPGTILQDGRYVPTPVKTSNVRVYDPKVDAYSILANISALSLVGSNFFCNTIQLRDKRLVLVPRDHTSSVYIDPVANTGVAGPAPDLTPTTTNKFRAAVTQNNGTIVAMPFNEARAGLITDRSGGLLFSQTLLSSRYLKTAA